MHYIPILEHIPHTMSVQSFQKEPEEDLTNLEQIHFRDLQLLSFQGLFKPPPHPPPLNQPNISYLSDTKKCSCEVALVFK
jgi:hypothetical protein